LRSFAPARSSGIRGIFGFELFAAVGIAEMRIASTSSLWRSSLCESRAVIPEVVPPPVRFERMTADTLDERLPRHPDVIRCVVAIEDVDSRLVESRAEELLALLHVE
jgi:hypothetical protein